MIIRPVSCVPVFPFVALILLAELLLSSRAEAIDYPCSSDPGFCYFDTGNDGCFDSGTDDGPIDDLLTAGNFPDPLPPEPLELPANPGSIVCPPSVQKLVMDADLRWRTALGGDILLYGTKIESVHDAIEMVAGRDLSLAHIEVRDLTTSSSEDLLFRAERNARLTGRVLHVSPRHFKRLDVVTETGDIVAEPKSSIVGSADSLDVHFTAGGNIALSGFRFSGHGPDLHADGDISLVGTTIKDAGGFLDVVGRNVTWTGNTKLKRTGILRIRATEDLLFETLSIGVASSVEMTARSVTVGTPVNGVLRNSTVRLRRGSASARLRVEATEQIRLEAVRIKGLFQDRASGESIIRTTGDAISLLGCEFRGDAHLTIAASGGSSICDFTGTFFEQFVFVETLCDTVIGP